MVDLNKNLLAPCGLYCGVCAIHIAHRDNNLKFKEKLKPLYGTFSKNIEDIKCDGCMSDDVIFGFCKKCPIRDCVKGKGIEGCHKCDDWPCGMIDRFPIPVGKKVILKDLPKWREMGTERWVEMVENRYKCPECGNSLFRGAKQCNKCKNPVSVD